MKDILERQIENNYSIIIYILALTEKRYDLFFKMMGGQSGHSYRSLRDIKNTLINVRNNNSFSGLLSVLNPDGSICKNHYLVAISLITEVPLEFVQKKISSAALWTTDQTWLEQTFTPKEISEIINAKNIWMKKIK